MRSPLEPMGKWIPPRLANKCQLVSSSSWLPVDQRHDAKIDYASLRNLV